MWNNSSTANRPRAAMNAAQIFPRRTFPLYHCPAARYSYFADIHPPSCPSYDATVCSFGSALLHSLPCSISNNWIRSFARAWNGLCHPPGPLRGNSLTCRWHPSALLSQLSRSCMFPRISPLALTNMHIDEQLNPFFCMGLEWPFSKRLIILVVRLAFWLALHHWRPWRSKIANFKKLID